METSEIIQYIAESLLRIIGFTGVIWLALRAGARNRARNRNR